MGKKIIISVNAALNNRGSEALINGLIIICKKAYPDSIIILASSEEDFENKADLPNVNKYVDKYINKSKKSVLRYVLDYMEKIFFLRQTSARIRHSKVLAVAKESDLIIVIGADNYDKSYNLFDSLHKLNKLFKRYSKAKLLLFDCSLEEKHIDNEVIKDINLFDVVTARENITFNNFQKYINRDKIYYFPDSAFILNTEPCELPRSWEDGNMVGINLSNLIVNEKYGSNQSLVLNSYFELMNYILINTNLKIILLPHVMKGADLGMLKLLYDKFKESNRVLLIEDESLKSSELKYIISKCRFFIGARTHSTIAAYSSCVPTLALGYSIKSRGIARDLFGTEENYVINVSTLKTEQELVDGFKWLQQNENSIRNHLLECMPEYKNKTWELSKFIKNLLMGC